MSIRKLVVVILLGIACCNLCLAQATPDSTAPGAVKITQQYINAVVRTSSRMAEDIDQQTEHYLARLEKQEARLRNKLSKIDSLAAGNIFADSKQQYQDIQQKIKNKSAALLKNTGSYLPWLDSAGTSLKFLQGNNPLIGHASGEMAKVTGAISQVKALENQFKQAGSVKEFIRRRKEYLTERLRNYDLGSDLKKYNQTAYYYTQQINEYRQAMDDPEKAVTRAMTLLRKIPAFQHFFHDHGALAGLFNVPEDYATAMTGLQTRDQVQNRMQSQISLLGPNAQAQVQQSIGAAQSELSRLRNQFPSSGSTGDMPDFKPKATKTKTFLKRLEYGTNVQTVKSSYFFPTTTDIAVSVGYKLSDNNLAGIGASYKMGYGKDIRHVALSAEGIGLRSFADIKLKGSFYVSGGLEYNYQQPFYPMTVFKNTFSSWQQSGLVGISKVVSLKTKFFRKTKVQALWDMLSYRQVPKAQAFKFRVGYSF